MARTKNKTKLVEPILFRPTNDILKMIDFILKKRPEIETRSQAIRVSIVRLFNDLQNEEVVRNGYIKSKRPM